MNPNIIKSEINKHLNELVEITIYGMRNKKVTLKGTIYKTYPSIFTVIIDNKEKGFSYSDIITGDIKIKYT